MKSKHQLLVEQYHADALTHGHDMHLFHSDWHRRNRETFPTRFQDPDFGINDDFGSRFLEMHHEMINLPADMPRKHMDHESIVAWYQRNGHAVPMSPKPSDVIPDELGYDPDETVFPKSIRQSIGQRTDLQRRQDTVGVPFQWPAYLTVEGARNLNEADPITGAMKLADFQNVNQLGCVMVFPHNDWHGHIGGAMGSTLTAIADPIFYWGVHWHIDLLFDQYKAIQARTRTFAIRDSDMMPSNIVREKREFTQEEREKVDRFVAATEAFHAHMLRPLTE